MQRRLATTEGILEELQRQNALSQEPIEAVVTIGRQSRLPGLRILANKSAEGSRGQTQ